MRVWRAPYRAPGSRARFPHAAALRILLPFALVLFATACGSCDVPDPDQPVVWLDGRRTAVRDLTANGRPALVLFWSMTCPPCLKEIPERNALYDELQRHGINMVAVAVRSDPPALVPEAVRKYGIRYPVALDLDGEFALTFNDADTWPSHYILSAEGRIVYESEGPVANEVLRRKLLP